MDRVSKTQIGRWGSYADRADSFDDVEDIHVFIHMCSSNLDLRNYIIDKLNLSTPTETNFRKHPDGQFDVDLGIVDKSGNRLLNIDIERWSVWAEDWPAHYKCISFLGRKDKFLNRGVPFLMCYFNHDRSKVLIAEESDILKTPSLDKEFKGKGVIDKIRSLPFSVGRIFGDVTEREKRLFKYADVA